MGRPTYLNAQTAERIITATRRGVHVETACQFAGISKPSYFLWLAKGKRDLEEREEGDYPEVDESHAHEWASEGEGPALRQGIRCWCGHTRYSDFVKRLLVAEAESQVALVDKVYGAVDADPKLGLFFMERRWPNLWARRDRLAVTATTDTEMPAPSVDAEPVAERLAKTLAILERAGRLERGSD